MDIDDKNFGTVSNEVNLRVTFPITNNGTYSLLTPFGAFLIPNALINLVSLDSQTPTNPLYDNGDQYKITMLNFDTSTFLPCAQIVFTRKVGTSFDDIISSTKDCFCTTSYKTTRIPIITILGQSMKNGSDTSDMTFTIFDKFTYDEKKCIVDNNKNHCQILRLECDKLK